jgi:hypothetical protein
LQSVAWIGALLDHVIFVFLFGFFITCDHAVLQDPIEVSLHVIRRQDVIVVFVLFLACSHPTPSGRRRDVIVLFFLVCDHRVTDRVIVKVVDDIVVEVIFEVRCLEIIGLEFVLFHHFFFGVDHIVILGH